MSGLTEEGANLQLLVYDAQAENLDRTDAFAFLLKKGVPVGVVTRLEELWDKTRVVGGRIVSFGKILFAKILEFVRAHPNTAIGMCLGAAIGALVSFVPLIGPLLAPLATAIGAAYGFMVGSRLDNPHAASPFEGLVLAARDFFAVLIDVLKTLGRTLFANRS